MIYVLNFKSYLKSVKEYLISIKKLKKLNTYFWLAINPYFYLSIYKILHKSKFKIGLQNLSILTDKPQTGEVVYDFELVNKAYFVLIGHSERFKLGENTEIVKNKLKGLQDKNLKLLIFFSENSYKPSKDFSSVRKETQKNLENYLKVIKPQNYKKILLVYEPWWAISSEKGITPSTKFLDEFLKWYKDRFNFPILYGGSYNSLLKEEYKNLDFQGFVLGKSSLSIKELKKIIG